MPLSDTEVVSDSPSWTQLHVSSRHGSYISQPPLNVGVRTSYVSLESVLYVVLQSSFLLFSADCAICSEGYGRGISKTCRSCQDTEGQLLTWAGVLASVVIILLVAIFAVVFLIGGFDAVNTLRKSVTRKVSMPCMKSKIWSVSRSSSPKPERRCRKNCSNATIAPAFDFTWENQRSPGESDTDHASRESSSTNPVPDVVGKACVRPCGAVVAPGTVVVLSDVPARRSSDVEMFTSENRRPSTVADLGSDGAIVTRTNNGGESRCCGVGVSSIAWASRLPLDKMKILVVVWQILTLFSSITDVEFPASYAIFLSWIDVVNLDIGRIVSASCILPSVNFYVRLLVTTLAPLVLAVGLLLTYYMATRRAGIGSAGVIARRAAWSRHVAAGLLLTFLVRLSRLFLRLRKPWAGIDTPG